MISLTSKEKRWTLLFLLPFYFIIGQYIVSFLLLLLVSLLNINIAMESLDAVFNMVYLLVMSVFALFIFKSYLKKSVLHLKGKWFKQLVYACTLGTLKFYIFNIISSLLIVLLNPNSSSANQNAIIQLTHVAPGVMFFTTVILAPFIEEMIFRVGIFQLFYDKSRLLAYVLSGVGFGFVHVMNGLFSGDISQLLFLLPYSILGLTLCHIYEKRDSIFVPMLVHSLNNLIAMMALL